MSVEAKEKSPVYVHCRPCGHEWVWVYMPMLASDLKKFMKIACPMCHVNGKDKIFMGKKSDGKIA